MEQTFKGKKIAVLGIGVEGLASAKYLQKKGAQVTLIDQKEADELAPDVRAEIETLSLPMILGETYLADLLHYDELVRSPGIKLATPELQNAIQHGVPVTSQTKIFFDLCPCHIIGVTGTKGKGTTATLIYEMLKAQGKSAYLGGNIGRPPFTFLDTLTAQSIVVLELSSFQLQDLTKSPHIAVMLMITSEHLDYHKDTAEYVAAKRNILKYQTAEDFAVINRDYPASNESDVETAGKVLQVSIERSGSEDGCYVRDEIVWLRQDGKEKKIIAVDEILLPGRHNLENVCAAVMAACLAGVTKEAIVRVLRTFKGLEHRLELVDDINGVRYYDDSFSTTPETAMAAIEAFPDPEILILGGSPKNSDFTGLGRIISRAKNIRAIIGIGTEWERIKEQITEPLSSFLLIEGAKSMREIVLAASKIATPGDVVLLTPACASFDMFKNYKDRGEQFKKEVKKLREQFTN